MRAINTCFRIVMVGALLDTARCMVDRCLHHTVVLFEWDVPSRVMAVAVAGEKAKHPFGRLGTTTSAF